MTDLQAPMLMTLLVNHISRRLHHAPALYMAGALQERTGLCCSWLLIQQIGGMTFHLSC